MLKLITLASKAQAVTLNNFMVASSASPAEPGDLLSYANGLAKATQLEVQHLEFNFTLNPLWNWAEILELIPETDARGRIASQATNVFNTSICEFKLLNGGKNVRNFTTNAMRSGDTGIYDELSVAIFDANKECVADILIGLTEEGEPRILVSSDGNSAGDKMIVYPMRDKSAFVSH